MKKYVKTFIFAFLVCECVELLYNFVYKENLQQILIGFFTSTFIGAFISFGFNFIKWEKILDIISRRTK